MTVYDLKAAIQLAEEMGAVDDMVVGVDIPAVGHYIEDIDLRDDPDRLSADDIDAWIEVSIVRSVPGDGGEPDMPFLRIERRVSEGA